MIPFLFDPAFEERMQAYEDAQDLHRLAAFRRARVARSTTLELCLGKKTSDIWTAGDGVPRDRALPRYGAA